MSIYYNEIIMKLEKRNIIASNIRAERNRRGISQLTLSELIGISENAMGKIERGQQTPSAIIIFDIAKALAIDINELFKGIE